MASPLIYNQTSLLTTPEAHHPITKTSSMDSESSYHARSISLPTRPHPLIPQIEDHLSRLRSSESSSTSSPSLICKLQNLTQLHDCVDELLLMQHNRQFLAQSKHVDDLLEASLRLLDISGGVKDALTESKGAVQKVQSALRRRNAAVEAAEYFASRKKVKADIKGSLKEAKGVAERCVSRGGCDSMFGILKAVEAATAEVFGAVMVRVLGLKRGGRWIRVSRGMKKEEDGGGFDEVDGDVEMLRKKGGVEFDEGERVRKKMVRLEEEIEELEEGVDGVFRRLVKTRAIFLNILSA